MRRKNILLVFCFWGVIILLNFSSIYGQEEIDKKLFEEKCNLCHSIDRPLSKKKNPADWKATVNTMRAKNPKNISEEEAEIIINYLNTIRGQVDINRVKDPNNLTDLEKKHAPVVTVDWNNVEKGEVSVKVEVGETPHPMEQDHYIKYIELFIGYKSAGKITLKPGDKPEHEFKSKIRIGDHIAAIIECNKHGLWEGGIR